MRLLAASWDPAAADYTGRKGTTLYVSKQGDNSDGSSWQKAFHTIQAALLAVPDDQGGHRVIVRPDTYVEANLWTNHKGAEGSYNLLIGDVDGSLGSGARGRIVIDSGDPDKGFKSYDLWGTIRATTQGLVGRAHRPDVLRHRLGPLDHPQPVRHRRRRRTVLGSDRQERPGLHGGHGGLRQHRTGVRRRIRLPGSPPEEPVVFRNCFMMALDWWGDAGALGVGAYNTSPPDYPDVVCENCTLAAPDNAVQILFPSKFIRLKLKDCRLMALNFSQPHGTPSSGVISTIVGDPRQVQVDFEDGLLMGFKLFGNTDPGANKTAGAGTNEITYTTQGKVQAYVQFRQPTPEGFERLGLWPVEAFRALNPRWPKAAVPAAAGPANAPKLPAVSGDPSMPGYAGHKGITLYVSKAGDNSDGSSWQKAFHTIQAALLAVPDNKGGHRVVIRPGTYEEANLYPSHRGAAGAYNLLVGDIDGSLGSGATGWVVIDSGCPGVAVRTDPTRPTGNPTFKIVESDLPESGTEVRRLVGPVAV